MTEQELLDLKKKIDKAKSKVSELKGRENGIMETLLQKWDCGSIKDAEKKIKELQKKIEELDEQKKEGIKELKENYDL